MIPVFALFGKYKDEDNELIGVYATPDAVRKGFRDKVVLPLRLLSQPDAAEAEHRDIVRESVEIGNGKYWVEAHGLETGE